MRAWAALLSVLVGVAAMVWAVGRAPGPGTPERGVADVLGGLVTLLEVDPLGCLGDTDLPADRDVEPDMDAIAGRTAELRALDYAEPVEHDLLDHAGMAALIRERFGGYSREDAARDIRILAALGAAPASADLRELRVDVFAEQVSGVYLGGDGTVSVRVDDPGALRPLEQVVAAHEYQHAVADQQLGRPRDARPDGEDADQRRASMAVVEGDAAFTMHLFAEATLDAGQWQDLRAHLAERAAEGALAAYPHWLREELRYPYVDGKAFVCTRYVEGGWAAVDALYTDPPDTSAEVLFPDRYGSTPAEPGALAGPGGRWEDAHHEAFGAADLLWLFRAPGDDPDAALDDPRAAAAGWDGGRVRLWTSGPRSVVALALVQRPGEADLCRSVADWYRAAFPTARVAEGGAAEGADLVAADGNQAAVLVCDGGQVRLGIAPSVELARRSIAAAG